MTVFLFVNRRSANESMLFNEVNNNAIFVWQTHVGNAK